MKGLAKEVAKFHFRTNKQFIDSGSRFVDLEQWTGFKGAVSGCLSCTKEGKGEGYNTQ
jgi:hypothetical protein